MRYHVLATDYDGTLAHDGRVTTDAIAALERVRASGRKLVLVSGRRLDDLAQTFDRADVFDLLVLENGAVLFEPSTRRVRVLAEPPPPAFAEQLRARGVPDVAEGHVIVATWEPHERTVLDVIRELGLELQVTFNKGAVMVLPSGVNKATGLAAALAELKLSPHDAVAVGDAENDHAMLALAECGVAVANALPALAERADWVTPRDHGNGVIDLADALVASDLAQARSKLDVRQAFPVGQARDGATVTLTPFGPPLLIAGSSGAGKSTFATSLLEQLIERKYQVCVVDPEGDFGTVEGAAALGDAQRPPTPAEVIDVLMSPEQNAVVNLLGVPLADRPAWFETLFLRLLELRAQVGRPHWIVIDEAHHVAPEERRPTELALPAVLTNVAMITLNPAELSHALLAKCERTFAFGTDPPRTLAEYATARGLQRPRAPAALAQGEALAWQPPADEATAFVPRVPTTERRRHIRKYAEGELPPDRSFYFRGPGARLNLRAQNLMLFLQVADGVDDETWVHHLRQGDYSRWFREKIKDPLLADEAERVERDDALSPIDSRARVREVVERHYTAPG